MAYVKKDAEGKKFIQSKKTGKRLYVKDKSTPPPKTKGGRYA